MRGIQSVNFVDDIHKSYTGMHAMYLLQRWRGQEKLSWEGAKKKKKQTQNSRDSQIIKFRKPNSSLHLIFCNLSYSKFQVFVSHKESNLVWIASLPLLLGIWASSSILDITSGQVFIWSSSQYYALILTYACNTRSSVQTNIGKLFLCESQHEWDVSWS